MTSVEEGPANQATHSFLFLYKDKKIVVVDSEYASTEGKLRISSLGGGLERARQLLKAMKGKRKVNSMYIGNGSTEEATGVNCNHLVQQFLAKFVADGGNWERDWETEGFDKMYN